MKFIRIVSIILFGVFCFVSGILWQKHKIIQTNIFELQEPLILQVSPGNEGFLPKGTILYHYSNDLDIDTFIAFINTKNLDVMKPISFERYLTVSPIDGYQK